MSADLRKRIAAAEAELAVLREQLAVAEAAETAETAPPTKWPLRPDEYERYARQLILPGVGVRGQLALKNASVVIIGAGGLGCPAATYLAGAGVGTLTLVDGDTVEVSNLHRQIAHTTARVGHYKVDSLAAALRQSQPAVRIVARREHLAPHNAAALIGPGRGVSLVLDCSDHARVRYLVSDACVRAGVPLVSAAALRTDGQLCVLNSPPGAAPCYRCVFPRPPPAASQTSCAEGGVLGPVVGVMGVLQALEAVRVLVQPDPVATPPPPPTLLLFSASTGGALGAPTFRTVRLTGQRADCYACGRDAPLQKLASLDAPDGSNEAWPDYAQFCGASTAAAQQILPPDARVSAQALCALQADATPHWLLDVREREFYDMGSIAGAVNVPFSRTRTVATDSEGKEGKEGKAAAWLPAGLADDARPIYVVCRVGNDSQVVARQLQAMGLGRGGARFIGDVQGGMQAWQRRIDATMPFV